MIKTLLLPFVMAMTTLSVIPGIAKTDTILPVNIPLQNSGFETGLNGWNDGTKLSDNITINVTEKRSGNNSLQIHSAQKGVYPYVRQKIDSVQSDSTYRFSAWARVAPGAPAVNAAVKIETYNAAGKNTQGNYGYIHLENDGQWQQFALTLHFDSDVTHCNLLLRVFGESTVLFDDITFETSEISVMNPVRSAAPVGDALNLNYDLKLYHPWTAKTLPAIKAELTSTDFAFAQQIATEVKPGEDQQHLQVTVPIQLSRIGDYQIHFSLMRDGQKYGTQYPPMIFGTSPQKKPTYLSDTGTFLHEGKPFFPIGMYHVRHDDAEYELLATNNFNAIQGPTVGSVKGLAAALARAKKHGLLVDVPLYAGTQVRKNLPISLEVAKAFSDDSTVLCWKILDEPEYNSAVANEIPQAYRALKSADPNHPIELTLARHGVQDFWANFCDMMQVDNYPIPGNPLTQVSELAQKASQLKLPWQNLSFVVQSGWNKDLSNQPSAAQACSMVYMALIGGAKGIWWYSMRESNGWDLTKTPLWPHIKDINSEIKVLSEPLMLGKEINSINCDQPKVLFRALEYQNKIYLLVTNPENEPIKATFTLPDSIQNYGLMNSTTREKVKDHKVIIDLQSVDSQTFIFEQ